MTLAAWTAWLWLTIPVLIEVVAVLARRTTPRLPGMMTGQRLAGYLIASVLLAAPAATASAANLTAGPTTTAPAPAAAAAPSAQADHASAPTKAAPHTAATGTYTVGEGGTTWWELAEQLLGDGARYQELRTLNPHAPKGQSLLPEGTTVTVPATASEQLKTEPVSYTQPVTAEAAPAKAEKKKDVTVRAGDSLSGIAQQRLGDAGRWPDLYAASKDRPQPHGLPQITDPDVIYPGQTVVLPHATPPKEPPAHTDDNPHEPADKTPQDNRSEPAHSPTAPAESGREDADTAPGPSASASAGNPVRSGQASRPAATAAPSSQNTTDTVPAPAEPTSAPSRTTELRTALGAFALLAAAVTGALGTRRLLQRRRRKVGETIAIGDAPSPAAAQLAQLAEPLLAPRFNLALRTLAHACDEAGQPLPALRVARLSQKSALSVLPVDEDSTPLAPFTAGQDGWWHLPDDAELLNEDRARDVTAPYPAFVTIGADERTGDLVLLNMAADRVVLLDGSEDDVRQVCRSIILELAMSDWSERLEIITLGFGEDLIRLLPTLRFGYRQKTEHALRDLADWMLASVQLPGESGDAYLLLCSTSLDPDSAWQLAEMLDKAGDLTVMVIAPAEHTARHFADAQVLDIRAMAPQHLDGTDVELIIQRIDDAAYQQITTDLHISGQPPHPAEGAWQAVPEEPHDSAPAAQMRQTPPAEEADAPQTASFGPADLGVFPALMAMGSGADGKPTETSAAAAAAGADTPSAPRPRGTTRVPQTAAEPQSPVLSVLGTVQIIGASGSSYGPREAQLAALLHFRPGRSADTLCTDMDPLSPWTHRTLNTRLGDLRRALGDDPEGNPYVPRRASLDDPYVLSPEVHCDWNEFKALAEDALVNGPADVALLEEALSMVRGRPFGTHLLPWAEPLAQEMVTRIIDVAHTVAQWRTEPGHRHDLVAARQAVAAGLEVDKSAELLYRDWFRIEHASGNRSGLHTAISRLQQINQCIEASPEPETQHLIQQLLNLELNS
ncbi:hypothetical protein ACIP5U_37105 [Streptomyces sp. NPDC088788]|uniref:hypothetical protein n=1 Tax=Streptomyces sp. NPDC088788 TaxID=3365898 RepID=UPI00382DF60E